MKLRLLSLVVLIQSASCAPRAYAPTPGSGGVTGVARLLPGARWYDPYYFATRALGEMDRLIDMATRDRAAGLLAEPAIAEGTARRRDLASMLDRFADDARINMNERDHVRVFLRETADSFRSHALDPATAQGFQYDDRWWQR
ncbi:MAG: hypothetical protein WCJ30_18760 [Deltaproteobacteria bacterium]